MSLWNIFGGRGKDAEQESENSSPFGTGTVDMTTLDITYITHRLLGESACVCVCVCLEKASKQTKQNCWLPRAREKGGLAVCLRRRPAGSASFCMCSRLSRPLRNMCFGFFCRTRCCCEDYQL